MAFFEESLSGFNPSTKSKKRIKNHGYEYLSLDLEYALFFDFELSKSAKKLFRQSKKQLKKSKNIKKTEN